MNRSSKDFFLEQEARDRKSLGLVRENRKRLIDEGCYPPRFRMPLGLQLELTSKCNLCCKHCYNFSGIDSPQDKMGIPEWVDFAKALVANGGIFQATITGGEPLVLGEGLFEVLDILSRDGTVFNLISNGFIFSKKVCNRLEKYNFFWIQISIDSSEESVHDDFRGVKGSWRKAIEAANWVANSGIPLRIASTISSSTLHEVDRICELARTIGATYLVLGDVIPSGRAFKHEEIFLSEDGRKELFQKIQNASKKYERDLLVLGGGSVKTQLEYASQPPIDGAIIRPDGNIRLDCSSPFVLGNVLEKDFFDIWNNTPSDCWENLLVQEYVRSVDYSSGCSPIIQNYLSPDVVISKLGETNGDQKEVSETQVR